MQTRKTLLALGFVSAISLIAVSAYAKSMTAQDFVTKASVANDFEIESSKAALDKSSDANVKTFAQQMIVDHTQAGKDLKKALKDSNSDAKPVPNLDPKHQKLLDTLNNSSGDNFDSKYIAMQTDAHKEAVTLFSNYADNGADGSLKDFAANTLPTLKKHLNHVEQLSK